MKLKWIVACCLLHTWIAPGILAQSVSQWVGSWEYSESTPNYTGTHNYDMIYSMRIRQIDNATVVFFDIDGYQTDVKVKAVPRPTSNGIEIVYTGKRSDGFGPTFNPGDVILELEMRDGKVITYWRKLKPLLGGATDPAPGVYFVKTH